MPRDPKLLDQIGQAHDAFEKGKAILGYCLGVTVVPVAAVIMIVVTTGKLRVIGCGLLVYSLILMAPLLIMAKLDRFERLAERDWRLPAGFVLMLIPLLLAGYQAYTMDEFKWMGIAFAAVPCWLLGVNALFSWAWDLVRNEDVERNDPQ